jgi:hypothetical protein
LQCLKNVLSLEPSVVRVLVLVCATAGACSSAKVGSSVTQPPAPDAGAPEAGAAPTFQADLPTVYVAKVKNLLVGLPPTDAEVTAVTADPTQLKTLVQGWMQLPQYAQKMRRFFELAFQQTQVTFVDFADQAYPRQIAVNATTTPLLVQNLQESFARTMLELVAEGQPLTAAMTTPKLMMTTALKELYAFLDVWQVDDSGTVTDRFKKANLGQQITVETAQGPIPIAETLDPTSASYMHWYDPDAATEDSTIAGCAMDPIVYPPSALTLHWLLYGSLDGRKLADGTSCPQIGGTATAPQLTTGDFSDWTMVNIRLPAAGEPTTLFYDLPTLRAATEIVLSIPRVGFFSTPAFFANWQTNISNQMRVTLNQALIVALGSSIDGTDSTVTPGSPPPGLDAAHAVGPCYSCHQTLDPLRSIFSASYSWNYHNQVDATLTAQPGIFAFQGVIQPVASMTDFGNVLAAHPLFPSAWVQKLCYYANSSPCAPDDPELQRIVSLFASSGFSWNALVAELFSSPLTTNASPTETTANGQVVAVSRRDHLCAALDNRLGFADVCGLAATTKKALMAAVPEIVSGLPSDGYGRGSTIPVLPNQPTLFFRAATENICEAVAAQVIDVAAAKQIAGVTSWSSANPSGAIADFVSTIMGLPPSDPRAAPATSLLQAHFSAAMQQGASASDALQSTFVTACLAPSAVSIGM